MVTVTIKNDLCIRDVWMSNMSPAHCEIFTLQCDGAEFKMMLINRSSVDPFEPLP